MGNSKKGDLHTYIVLMSTSTSDLLSRFSEGLLETPSTPNQSLLSSPGAEGVDPVIVNTNGVDPP